MTRISPWRTWWPLLLGLLLAGASVSGCQSQSGQGPGHRDQHLALTPDQELAIGEKAYQEVLHKYQPLPGDSPEVRRVRKVGKAIEATIQIEPLLKEINLVHVTDYRWEWEFNVLQSDQINAFCLPGGKVAVFTGLLPVAQNDDQLATVMGHEIAHALAHHASERLYRTEKVNKALEFINGTLSNSRESQELIGILAAGAQVGGLSYDRQQESEADHIGIFLMTFAGYNPDQAVVFWQRMEQRAGSGHVPEILSDHPSDARRIKQIQQWVVQAKAGKAAYDQGRIAP